MRARSWKHLIAAVTMVPELGLLLAGLSLVTGFIIPEELPSLLSLLYSNIPPVKKGTDSRVGFGFRLGPHADFQIMVEVGPQSNTAPIGPEGEPPGKRDTLRMENPQTLVNMINTWKMPLGQDNTQNDGEGDTVIGETAQKNIEFNDSLENDVQTPTEKMSMSTGGGWINSWKNAFSQGSYYSKIKFKPVAGIDYSANSLKSRRDYLPKVVNAKWSHVPKVRAQPVYVAYPQRRLTFVDHLQQLYIQPQGHT